MKLLKITLVIAVAFGVYTYFTDSSIINNYTLTISHPIETSDFKVSFPSKPTYKKSTKNSSAGTIASERYYVYGDNHSFNINITKLSNGNFNLSLESLKNQLQKKYKGKVETSKYINNNGKPGIHVKILQDNGKFISMKEYGNGNISYRATVTLKNNEENRKIESEFFESFYIKS